MDWSLLVSDNYSIFIKFELGDHRRKINDENMHIRFINDMLSENDFYFFYILYIYILK